MTRAVLFDLDDTLFDHRHCARAALADLHQAHEPFRLQPFDLFEQTHAALLEELHVRVLAGALGLDEARRERFRRLFEASGAIQGTDAVALAASRYREGYQRARGPVPGAARLLALVKSRARVAIVSNNLLEEQREKLRHCGLDAWVDALVVSEEAGVSKPDPRIFAIALERLGCTAGEAAMVGDSWVADVVGARAAGLRAIWFNRLRHPRPAPLSGIAELHTLDPPDEALAAIFTGAGTPPGGEPESHQQAGAGCGLE